MLLAEGWEEIFNSLAGVLTVVFLFGGWIIVAVVGYITKSWRRIHESEHAAVLKQSMIERGMSVDEIERVMRAGPESQRDSDKEDDADDMTKLSEKLVEHSVPAADLEQIVVTFRAAGTATRKSMKKTIEAMLDGGADSAQVLAVVRALSRPVSPESSQDGHYRDDAASLRR
jgi:hypothetical protein